MGSLSFHGMRLLLLLAALGLLSLSSVLAQGVPQMRCITNHCWRERDGTYGIKVSAHQSGSLSSNMLYKYGEFCVDLKLPRGRTKGTVIAFYLLDSTTKSNKDWRRSEIDTEIYGNDNEWNYGYTSNVFTQGQQNLAKFKLPLNANQNFNKYCMRWGRNSIVWSVNGTPFRALTRSPGKPWPSRASKLRLSYWDCSSYCGAQDFRNGGFTLKAKNFRVTGCLAKEGAQPSAWSKCQNNKGWTPWNRGLTGRERAALANSQKRNTKAFYGWSRA